MTWTVLITDGEQRSALATARSLGRAGHIVHVCAARKRSLAGASRYSVSDSEVPDPLRDPDAFVAALASLSRSVGADVLLPISEASLLAVLPQRDRFACAVPFAAADQFSAICDKARVLEAAVAHGIAVPQQRRVASPEQAAEATIGLMFPVVLKPFRSVVGDAGNRRKVGVLYAFSAEELQRTLARIAPEAYPVLVQQRIEGSGTAISVLIWDGQLRAAFGHRRLREKPPSGGVSVLRESIPINPDLLERSLALLRDFQWKGVAMVEFKVDARSGIPYLMEINGRLWGSLQLAIDAGVDFPRLLVDAAMGQSTEAVPAYPAGVKTQWELGDVDHLLLMLRHSAQALNLPPQSPGRWRAIGNFFRAFGPGIKHEVFRFGDPYPFVRESIDWIARR